MQQTSTKAGHENSCPSGRLSGDASPAHGSKVDSKIDAESRSCDPASPGGGAGLLKPIQESESKADTDFLSAGLPWSFSPADDAIVDKEVDSESPFTALVLPGDNESIQKLIHEDSDPKADMDIGDGGIGEKEDSASSQGLSTLPNPSLPRTSEFVSQLEFLEVARRHSLPDTVAKEMKANVDYYSGQNGVDHIIKGIAEIVMVLAGLGQIRAQRPPSYVERELQTEAYANLAFLVQNLAPRDVVGKRSIENLIEELDLRRTKKRREPASTLTDMQGASTDKVFSAMNDEREPLFHDHSMFLDPSVSAVDEATLGDEEEKVLAPFLAPTPDSSLTADAGHTESEAAFTQKQLRRAMQQWVQLHASKVQPTSHSAKPYMAVSLPCELCKLIVKDTVSVLICDACERAYHLKCLQLYRFRDLPEGDWHCPNCLIETQGQHWIPNYGRVKPGTTFFSNSDIIGESQEERILIRVQVEGRLPNQPSVSTAMAGTTETGTTETGTIETGATETEVINKHDGKKDGTILPGDIDRIADRLLGLPSNQAVMQGRWRVSLQDSGNDIPTLLNSTQADEAQHQNMGIIGQSSIQTQLGTSALTQSSEKMLQKEGLLSRQETGALFSSQPMKTSPESLVDQNIVASPGDVNGSGQDGSVEDVDQFVVEWLGDILHSSDGKAFYSSCRVGDFVYKLHDYALFRPETPDIPPYIARLQSLWEDNVTKSKWVRVNWCYYPTDIPVVVNRPSNPEANEVYESNHGDNNLVGSIQGPCLVLRPEKYFKEIERRRELLRSGHASEGLFPIFLCRWLYDAPRGIFRLAI